MLTMLPPPLSSMPGATSWHSANVAVRFTATVDANSSTSCSTAGTTPLTPALLTSTSTRPNVSAAVATSRRRSASTVTSQATATLPGHCWATACSRDSRRPARTTVAPAAVSTSAKRAPRPLDAPVTTATAPSRPKSALGSGAMADGASHAQPHVGDDIAVLAEMDVDRLTWADLVGEGRPDENLGVQFGEPLVGGPQFHRRGLGR